MKNLLISLFLFSSSLAYGFEGTFFDPNLVPSTIESVHMEVFDMARTELGCSFEVCFRMDIYINGVFVARWGTSPGDPNNDVDFNGVNTPRYNNRSLNRDRIMGPGYESWRGDSMPYAMFILGPEGQNTGFAVHAGHVTGEKESHGCIRLQYANAQMLNGWVKKAIANGGPTTITTYHTVD